MLTAKYQAELRERMQATLENAIETHAGSCCVETKEAEHSYKWRNGQAGICIEDEETGKAVEVVFGVQIVLLSVETQ